MGVELPSGNSAFHEMEDVNFSDKELAHHVRNALKSALVGENESYNELIGVLHHKERLSPDEVAMLETCLKALSGAISSLDVVHHESLLSSIFGMSMWNYGPEVMDALVELIISLAESGKYVEECLDMLVKNFVPPYSFLPLLRQPRGISRKDHVLSRVHFALESITELVPLAPTKLWSLVVHRMPRQNDSEAVVLIYAENLFRLESGAIGEFLGENMLKAVMDRLIDLDLDIAWEDILQDDTNKGIFELELEDVDDFEDDIEDDNGELPGGIMNRKCLRGNVVARKLDSLLVLTFEHLEYCKDQRRLDKVFRILLDSFRRTVLNSYKSKFAQFVMFYACSLDPENCGKRFATTLADIFVCNGNPPITRMGAVAYLASYLARGKFISTDFIAAILRRLVDWCLAYSEIQRDVEINPQAHRIFYSCCQAIMYVFCFRMRSMVKVPWLASQISCMPLEPILKHRLDPLKVCLPSVVDEFLRQAKAAHLFTVSEQFIFNDLLESELSKAYGGLERLDMFFPFDPCLLLKSDRFIRPKYIFWSMVRASNAADEEGSSEEEEDDEFVDATQENLDARDGDVMATSYNDREFDLDEFDYALNKMSITPKNQNFMDASQQLMRMPSKIRPSTSPRSL